MSSAKCLVYSEGIWCDADMDLITSSTLALPSYCYVFLAENVFDELMTSVNKNSWEKYSPGLLGELVCSKSNGFFTCQSAFDERGDLVRLITLIRCQVKMISSHLTDYRGYEWITMTFVASWTQHESSVLCFGVPLEARRRFSSVLTKDKPDFSIRDPFALIVPIINEVVVLYDQSVWRIRDLIRTMEMDREGKTTGQLDFSKLHDIARHAIHSNETLDAVVLSLTALRTKRRELDAEKMTARQDQSYAEIGVQIDFQLHLLQSLKLRSEANEKRLQNEITLAFNTVIQRDSKVMVEINNAVRMDGTAMKTVAIVTMAFLPATFVSSIFSMSFFNFNPGNGNKSWSVSEKIWVYWVIAISLTVITMLIWFALQFDKLKSILIRPLETKSAHIMPQKEGKSHITV